MPGSVNFNTPILNPLDQELYNLAEKVFNILNDFDPAAPPSPRDQLAQVFFLLNPAQQLISKIKCIQNNAVKQNLRAMVNLIENTMASCNYSYADRTIQNTRYNIISQISEAIPQNSDVAPIPMRSRSLSDSSIASNGSHSSGFTIFSDDEIKQQIHTETLMRNTSNSFSLPRSSSMSSVASLTSVHSYKIANSSQSTSSLREGSQGLNGGPLGVFTPVDSTQTSTISDPCFTNTSAERVIDIADPETTMSDVASAIDDAVQARRRGQTIKSVMARFVRYSAVSSHGLTLIKIATLVSFYCADQLRHCSTDGAAAVSQVIMENDNVVVNFDNYCSLFRRVASPFLQGYSPMVTMSFIFALSTASIIMKALVLWPLRDKTLSERVKVIIKNIFTSGYLWKVCFYVSFSVLFSTLRGINAFSTVNISDYPNELDVNHVTNLANIAACTGSEVAKDGFQCLYKTMMPNLTELAKKALVPYILAGATGAFLFLEEIWCCAWWCIGKYPRRKTRSVKAVSMPQRKPTEYTRLIDTEFPQSSDSMSDYGSGRILLLNPAADDAVSTTPSRRSSITGGAPLAEYKSVKDIFTQDNFNSYQEYINILTRLCNKNPKTEKLMELSDSFSKFAYIVSQLREMTAQDKQTYNPRHLEKLVNITMCKRMYGNVEEVILLNIHKKNTSIVNTLIPSMKILREALGNSIWTGAKGMEDEGYRTVKYFEETVGTINKDLDIKFYQQNISYTVPQTIINSAIAAFKTDNPRLFSYDPPTGDDVYMYRNALHLFIARIEANSYFNKAVVTSQLQQIPHHLQLPELTHGANGSLCPFNADDAQEFYRNAIVQLTKGFSLEEVLAEAGTG